MCNYATYSNSWFSSKWSRFNSQYGISFTINYCPINWGQTSSSIILISMPMNSNHSKLSLLKCSVNSVRLIWSSSQDAWFSPRWPGFHSRYGNSSGHHSWCLDLFRIDRFDQFVLIVFFSRQHSLDPDASWGLVAAGADRLSPGHLHL